MVNRSVLSQCASEALQLNMHHQTSDVLGGNIQIFDVGYGVFRALLQYLYTGKLPPLQVGPTPDRPAKKSRTRDNKAKGKAKVEGKGKGKGEIKGGGGRGGGGAGSAEPETRVRVLPLDALCAIK